MFIDGFLALLTAAGPGAGTEFAGAGYARQPIAFGEPADGICYSATPYSFSQLRVPGWAGRAIYDAPAGGNLLLVLPHPVPLSGWRPPWDGGDAGTLRLLFTAMQAFHRGGSFTGRMPAGAVIGACSDTYDVLNQNDLSQDQGNPRPLINTAAMSTGVALSIARGVLQASSAVPAGAE